LVAFVLTRSLSVKIVLIDFHTHTNASDGALAPVEMIDRAVARNIDLLAITDHDTVAGYRAAAGYYTQNPGKMRLIPGIEYSCRWSGTTVHIVGLGIDSDHPAMREGLAVLEQARRERGVKIGSRLESRGFEGALQGALAEAGDSQLGRPHFAAWMVEQGHVADHNTAFDKYLGQGKIGDVKAYWPELDQVTQWIEGSGGAAIIAHPLKYRFTRMKLRRLVIDFMAAGGSGIEVLSGRQTTDQTAQLKRLAAEFELEASVGSDFHRDAPYGPQLGVELPQLEGLRGVWERWSAPGPAYVP
jgi:predicted metal-dependent phosphoesterase TrpH